MADRAVADVQQRRELTDTEFRVGRVEDPDDPISRLVRERRQNVDIVERSTADGGLQCLQLFDPSLDVLVLTAPEFVRQMAWKCSWTDTQSD